MEKLPQDRINTGLTSAEVKKRLVEYGENELEKKKEYSVAGLVAAQFKSPLIAVLVLAGLATMMLRDWVDAMVIWLAVGMNVVLGFWQEFKAAKSLTALKSYLQPTVIVVRDGNKQEIIMSQLVPGDIVLMTAGDSIPADGVWLEAEELLANEAILTGESRLVEKAKIHGRLWKVKLLMVEPTNVESRHYGYMGTHVARGVGKLLVLSTGSKTQMGKIADELVTTKETKTPMQIKMEDLARKLITIVTVIVIILIGVGITRGEEAIVMVETAIAAGVAAIPEGMSVSVTVILALGMQRILKKKALVRKLVAAETLGSVSVICCDKTGTLTEGKMSVVSYIGDRDELLKAALLANDERDEEGVAMRDWVERELKKGGVTWTRLDNVNEIKNKCIRLSSIPFSSHHKYATSVNQVGDRRELLVVGAPEIVMNRCYLSGTRRRTEMMRIEGLAVKGFRLIGIATKRINTQNQMFKVKHDHLRQLGWQGLLVFRDPVREKVKESLLAAQRAGVAVKVITGDYKETAMAVLGELWEGQKLTEEQIITGEELSRLSKPALAERINEIVLFARTTPDQKLKIVEALRAKGEVVAMTGDGVNDAPALKAADIGVVVNEATDVSKQTADMVLLNSNFRTIVAAIREGRIIYETMRKMVTYLVAGSFEKIVLVGGSLILDIPMPLTVVQILWINLIEDGLPGIALAFDYRDEGVMRHKPAVLRKSLLDKTMWGLIIAIGIVANVMLLSVYWILWRWGMDLDKLRTLVFVIVGTNSLMYIFSVKSLKKNVWQGSIVDNKYLLLAVGVGLVMMLLSIYAPFLSKFLGTVKLKPQELLAGLEMSILTMGMIEGVKYFGKKRIKHEERKNPNDK